MPRPRALAKTCKSLTLGLATCMLGTCRHMPVGMRGSSTMQSSNLLHIDRSGQREGQPHRHGRPRPNLHAQDARCKQLSRVHFRLKSCTGSPEAHADTDRA